MGTLIYLEARLQSDSGNINYAGFKVDVSSNAYVDFITKRGSLEAAAQAMAGDIRTAMQTQTLTVAERTQLMGVLTEIVGSAELAEAYVGQVVAGADVESGKVSANVDESGESGYNERQEAKEYVNSSAGLVEKVKRLGDNLLDIMETSGGHTIERHVGKSIEYLTERASRMRKGAEGATSFTDKNNASYAIQGTIQQNEHRIVEWLNSSDNTRLVLNGASSTTIGYGYSNKLGRYVDNLVNIRMVLERADNELGFIIKTCYPTF